MKMPAPYGHQQGGTRRKKNRKGKGRKSRARRGRKLMRGGGEIDMNKFWENGGTVDKKRWPSTKYPSYKITWDPTKNTFKFSFQKFAYGFYEKIVEEEFNTYVKAAYIHKGTAPLLTVGRYNFNYPISVNVENDKIKNITYYTNDENKYKNKQKQTEIIIENSEDGDWNAFKESLLTFNNGPSEEFVKGNNVNYFDNYNSKVLF